MKINWGTGIVIAFALFMAFILYFVFEVQSNSKYDNDLVVEEYYKHDTHFSEELQRIQNAQDLVEKPIVETTFTEVIVRFPSSFVPNKIKGSVALYRPSNKRMDFEIPISISNQTLRIPKKRFLGGRWNLNMEWQYEGKSYLTKEVIYLN